MFPSSPVFKCAAALTLLAAVSAAGGGTAPAGLAAGGADPTTATRQSAGATTGAVSPDYDLSFFFPKDLRPSNAAGAYARAYEYFDADPDRTKIGTKWDLLLDRPLIRRALDHVTSGAQCQWCDFIPFLPDDLARRTKFPYLYPTQILAKLLAAQTDRRLEQNDRQGAIDSARVLAAFGRHLRQSAFVLSQEIQGIAIERLAVTQFQKVLGPEADAATSAKLALLDRLLQWSQDTVIDHLTSHSKAGGGFKADRAWLQSPYPVFRCEAILNMAEATFPPSVLLKPTPPVSLRSVMEKVALTTTDTIPLREEAFPDPEIKWPRKGVRRTVTREDALTIREMLEPVAKFDPDPCVRVLARRFLDSLIEPKPAPTPRLRRGDGPTTPGLRRPPPGRRTPPPPRPPGSRRPPIFNIPPGQK